jgi:hypothetical protein
MSERITDANRKLSKSPNRHARCRFTVLVENGVALGRNRAANDCWLSVRGTVLGRELKGVRNKYNKANRNGGPVK